MSSKSIRPPVSKAKPSKTTPITSNWYQRRDELKPNMVFKDFEGDVVRLDRRVPGDGTKWYVATASGLNWCYDDTIIEPGDLREYLYTG